MGLYRGAHDARSLATTVVLAMNWSIARDRFALAILPSRTADTACRLTPCLAAKAAAVMPRWARAMRKARLRASWARRRVDCDNVAASGQRTLAKVHQPLPLSTPRLDTFAARLRFARRSVERSLDKELSGKELADRVGVTKAAYSAWERGGGEPGRENLEALAGALGVDPGWLWLGGPLDGGDPPTPVVEDAAAPAFRAAVGAQPMSGERAPLRRRAKGG